MKVTIYPYSINKGDIRVNPYISDFIHQRLHPCTATERNHNCQSPAQESVIQPQPPETDLLIWGNISRYKGVPEFVRFATQHSLKLKTKIIGKCSSQELLEELRKESNEMISIEDRSIPFEELKQEIRRSRFVLVPYAAESILSSGILMDSLSFGAKVIGLLCGISPLLFQNLLQKIIQ